MDKLLVILGPTATGKTDLGITLAKKFKGEIVSADSRQVYIGLDIGTGKKPGKDQVFQIHDWGWEIDGIPVYLYDVAQPMAQFSVKSYAEMAQSKIADITRRGKLPIIVGGTGFYIKALLQGLPNLQIPLDQSLRERLNSLSLPELQEELKKLSPDRWEKLNNSDKQNSRRLIRSIELLTMNPYKNTDLEIVGLQNKYSVLKIGLTYPREKLKDRIYQRLLKRLDEGLVDEGHRLFQHGLSSRRMRELGLEYRYLADLLEDKMSYEEFVEILTIKISQYAKRQMTWFKKEEGINWFDIGQQNLDQKVEKLVSAWYHGK